MTRTLLNRLARLEAALPETQSGLVVIQYHDGDEAGRKALIADLIARGEAKEADTFVCVRDFGESPSPPRAHSRMGGGETRPLDHALAGASR